MLTFFVVLLLYANIRILHVKSCIYIYLYVQLKVMFLTNVLCKKVKSKHILVLVESVASGHKRIKMRERLADKIEEVQFDPYVRADVIYRELKKVKSL